MSKNEMLVGVPPEVVFAVLADPHAYSDWVVGAKRIRKYDRHWPEPGTSFHHTVGLGPIATRDKTTVVSIDMPRRLVLRARAMPAGVAEVAIDVWPDDAGSRVVIAERPLAGLGKMLYNPLLDLLIRARNAESLRRLRRIAEGRAAHVASPV